MAIEQTNDMHNMMTSSFGDNKWSKERELNKGMSIKPSQPDAYTNAINGGFGGAH